MKNLIFRNDVLPLKNKLYRLALRITLDHAEAEDVVQETMIKVWNRREQWEQIESMEAFCMTICRNIALDKNRRAGRDNESLEQGGYEAQTTDAAFDPEQQTVLNDRLKIVRQIVNSLPEKQRSVMLLRETEGKSYKEIAAILGITEEQVKVNIFRARQTIKQRFIQTENYGLQIH